jgi:hypothetical protein
MVSVSLQQLSAGFDMMHRVDEPAVVSLLLRIHASNGAAALLDASPFPDWPATDLDERSGSSADLATVRRG